MSSLLSIPLPIRPWSRSLLFSDAWDYWPWRDQAGSHVRTSPISLSLSLSGTLLCECHWTLVVSFTNRAICQFYKIFGFGICPPDGCCLWNLEGKWKKNMWIGIPILLSHWFYNFRSLRKCVAWLWLPHRETLSGYIDIFKIWCHDKKKVNSNSSKIQRPLPIRIKFSMEYNLVWVHSYTNFKLNNSKFSQVTQLRENFRKNPNLKNFECLNRFWPNSIPKVLDRYIIFVCNLRAIAQILRKLKLPQASFKKLEIQ